MTNTTIDPDCIVCNGSGEFSPEPDQEHIPCPLCITNSRLEAAVTALHKIADFGKLKINQPMIRAFHRETIAIAEEELKRLEILPAGADTICTLSDRSNHHGKRKTKHQNTCGKPG